MVKTDKNHRPIACDTCDPEDPTIIDAWASDWLLEQQEVSSIDELDDEDVYRLERIHPEECSIEGHCYDCNGPDDGDDGNQDD